ncbi:uncharacterized membrane protein YhaH (DUF805 family) [Arthrobacter pigmenti]|uniref:Uncharacterized membrane protein YhaH (DUF805 family) n=1 Tax=Arthrobacter pigmenti TaxID=271432 RepID=A0A846RV57_9MICC|nr:DUF805 domain-containing protein [Arthrobacter pigmenti]NJC24047.1 uncharacterized membrane protein YhaH (DUF805 family) [Arthrobacter pigmenti]
MKGTSMSYHPATAQPTSEARLDQPLHDASFGSAVKRFFKKYATFSGRASRSEYWWVVLFNFLVSMVLSVVMIAGAFIGMDPETGTPGGGLIVGAILVSLYGLAIIIPSIAVSVRRLHDGNFSGWWYLLSFIPGGSIVVLIFMLLPSNPQGARFDANAGYGPGGYGPAGGGYGQPGQGYGQDYPGR